MYVLHLFLVAHNAMSLTETCIRYYTDYMQDLTWPNALLKRLKRTSQLL